MKPASPAAEGIRKQLERIVASPGFSNAARMIRFLRFTVEQTLAGETDRIKEYVLGVEVFDRRAAFDPRSDSVVRVEARRLRAKLQEYYASEEGRSDPILIEFPKGSYVPVFHENPGIAPAPAPRRRFQSYAMAAAAMLAAIAIGFTIQALRVRPARPAPASIAVLPFADLSARQDLKYLCAGIGEEVTHSLGQVPGLRVPGRSAVAALAGVSADEIGRRLNVANVLEGSVRRDGDRVRVTIDLMRLADQTQLWSRSFDARGPAEIPLEQEIARAISSRVRLHLLASRRKGAAGAEEDPEVRSLYLLGRFWTNKMTIPGARKAAGYFEEAVRRDPKSARAYAGLADAYDVAFLFEALPWRRASTEVKSAALHAISLDESAAEAHASLARALMWVDRDWPAAAQELERAIDLDPEYAEAYQLYAWNLAYRGRTAEALEAAQKAVDLDPLSTRVRNVMAMMLLISRQYDRSIEAAQQAIDMDPNYGRAYQTLARAYALERRQDDALRAVRKSIDLGAGGGGKSLLGWVYASTGGRAEARDIVRDLSIADPPPAFGLAGIHAALGQPDEAFEWLERAYRNHNFMADLVTPDWDVLRPDPRYKNLIHRVGLQ